MANLRLYGLVLVLALASVAGRAAEPEADAPMQREATEASADKLLDESLLNNPARRAEVIAEADQAPPNSTDPSTLAQFYYRRGKAAITIGRQAQGIADLIKATDLSRDGSTGIDRVDAVYTLALAEANTSRYAGAVRHAIEATRVAQTGTGKHIAAYALLVESYTNVGDVDSAAAALEKCREAHSKALQNSRIASNPNSRMLWDGNLSRCESSYLQATGKYAEAEPHLRKVLANWESSSNRNTFMVGNRHLVLANNLRLQGRLAEAENETRAALTVYQRTVGANSLLAGKALMQIGRLLADQGRAKESEALGRKGIEVILASGSKRVGAAHTVMADILAADYRWQEARAEFDAMKADFADDPVGLDGLLRRSNTYPLVLLYSGSPAEAEKLFDTLLAANKAALGDKAYATAEARGFKAAALAATGHADQALAEFRAAVPVLLTGLGDEDDDGGNRSRDQRLRLILEADMRELWRMIAKGPANGSQLMAEAFGLADAARGRTVLRALAASAARSAADTPELASMARREQDAQKQISALNGMLANAISAHAEAQDDGVIASLKSRIAKLKDERAEVVKQIAARFPDYAKILNPQPATLADAAAALKPGEAMLATYSAEDAVYAWAVAAGGKAAMTSAPIGRLKLEAQVKQLRQALDLTVSGIDEIPAFDLKSANSLYAALLQPTEKAWGEAKLLFVVPHGPLGQLPMALLPTAPPDAKFAKGKVPFAEYRAVPWLSRRVAIAQLPSVGALATLRALPVHSKPRRTFLAFGDPLFSKDDVAEAPAQAVTQRGIKRRSAPAVTADYSAELSQLPRLPDTAEEITSIAKVLGADPAQDLYLQARASEGNVRKLDLTNWRILMFATHGLIPGDLTGLTQPALALSSPAITGEGGTGLLTMERILALRLDADWVVLSACNTALGDGAGAEAVSGLGRAFFYAGARALLVSNWPVETSAARMLTSDLFRRQVENPALARAEALRLSTLALIDGPGPQDGAGHEQFSYAHPTFWAPFSLVGDGGSVPH